MTDFTQPVCQLTSLQSNCSTNCSTSTWNLAVRVSDGAEGSGVDLVSLKQGNGTMNATKDPSNQNITLVSYRATCCEPDMELLVVDRVGNTGSCFYSLNGKPPSAQSASTRVTLSPFLGLLSVVLSKLHAITELGIQ